MSLYSEMMGSFVRTGNYPMEANYIFNTVEDLVDFYRDPINKTTLHIGLFRIVVNDSQALYWAVPNENGDLYFEKLIDYNTIGDVDQLKEKLELEIKDRILGDLAIWGTVDPTKIDESLNSILKISLVILDIKEKLEDLDERLDGLKEDIKAIVGTELDDVIEYLKTLDYKNLTELSDTLHFFLNTKDPDNELINTLPEIQDFLNGFTDKDTLLQILTDLWHNILGDPLPNREFRTLRGIEDFVETLALATKNRIDNLLTELDQTQIGVGLSGDGSYNSDKETYHLKDATSVMNALKILDSLINEAINNCNILVEDSETVDMSIIKEPTKTTISARVKVSSELNNDIITKDDGIYHNIDSEYQNGILTIKVNGNVRLLHVLGLSSIVDTAYYDTTLEAIIIVFRLLNGEKLTVTIPAGALILEWGVDNSISTKVVELVKERVISGADKLSADVRISTNKYNVLEKDANTLLVKGTADNIIYDGDVTVKTKLDNLTSHDEETDNQISDFNKRLDEEIQRSLEAEREIQTALNEEIRRSTEKDGLLEENLTNEIQRAKESEKSLQETLNAEISRSTDADNKHERDLQDEVNRAKLSELELSNKIVLETERATNAETLLDHKIDDTNTALNAEIERAKQAEKDLSSSITNLDSTILETSSRLDLEINRSITKDELLLSAINIEVDRASKAESAITKLILDLIVKCISANATDANSALNQLAKLGTKYSTVEEIGKTLKNFLEDNDFADSTINKWKEILKFLEGVTDLETLLGLLESISIGNKEDIDRILQDLINEINRSKLAELELLNNIDREVLRATNAESLLEKSVESAVQDINNINAELSNTKDRLNDLIVKSSEEDAKLANNITNLSSRLDSEISRAISKENDIISNINNISDKVTEHITLISDILKKNNDQDTKIANLTATVNTNKVELQNSINTEKNRAIAAEILISDELHHHLIDYDNPHKVTAELINVYTKTETDNLLKESSNSTDSKVKEVLDHLDVLLSDFNRHTLDTNNPHHVTKDQIGLDKVDNTSDLEKPISVAVLDALNTINIELSKKAESTDFLDHIYDYDNPHRVNKELVGLGLVDNTADLDKPISKATQEALDNKTDIGHLHVMSDIADLENLPIIKGFINVLGELPDNPANRDKYIITTPNSSSNKYTILEWIAKEDRWNLKLLTTGGIACVIGGDVYKLNSDGIERILDVSDYLYFYNKIYDETKNLIEDIDWEENDATNDTNLLIRLKITYKKSYGNPNEPEATNPYKAKAVKYIDIDKSRFLANAYSRPATLEDVNNGYATTIGEPLLILVMTTGDHITISLKDALNIYDPVDTPSVDMSVSDWTGNPSTSYKVSADVRIATTLDKTDAISLHILNSTEKGLYSTLHTTNTNSITLNPTYGSAGLLKSLTATLKIDNTLNDKSDVALSVGTSGLSAKIIWGEYD